MRGEQVEGGEAGGRQKACFASVSLSEASMSGVASSSTVGVKRWSSPGRYSTGSASGKPSVLMNSTVSGPMATTTAG